MTIRFARVIASSVLLTMGFICALLSARPAVAAPELLKEIGETRVSIIQGEAGVTGEVATFNSTAAGEQVIVGRGQTDSNGTELVIYKVTSNTYETVDLRVGSQNSSPSNFTVFGNIVLFTAITDAEGTELWKTDGTAAGTTLVKDINSGTASSLPSDLVVFGGVVLFSATTAAEGRELFATDGTSGGTVLVKDIQAGATGSQPASLTAGPGGAVYFFATTGAEGREIWKTDGTSVGTLLLKDIQVGSSSSNPIALTYDAANSRLYFSADQTGSGIEPWVSDGTTGGTTLLKDIAAGGSNSNAQGFVAGLGKVFFYASTSADGREPYVTDGTTGGTSRLVDIKSGTNSSNPEFFGVAGTKVIFSADDGTIGEEIWATDGTTPGTALLADLKTGSSSSDPHFLGSPNAGKIIFYAENSSVGRELFVTDGTSGGTGVLKNIYSGAVSSDPSPVLLIGTDYYFNALNDIDGVPKRVLMKSDGTEGNTVVVNNSSTAITNGISADATVLFQSKAFFELSDGLHGSELWSSDGTTTNTALLLDAIPGRDGSNPNHLTPIGSTLFFIGSSSDGNDELMKTDGSSSAFTQLTLFGTGSLAGDGIVNLNGTAIFVGGATGTTGRELFKTDGTGLGTVILKDISAGAGNGITDEILQKAVTSTKLFFAANDGTNGQELWATDGTSDGTVLVKDLNSGAGGSSPTEIVSIGSGKVLFSADDGSGIGTELYISDGTSGGTTLLKDINVGANSSSPQYFTVSDNGTVFFAAITDAAGLELWKTDGTTAGTAIVKDINPGVDSSEPEELTVFGNNVVFVATDATSGREPRFSDGTDAGTVLLKDIDPGTDSSGAGDFIFVESADTNGLVLFSASDGSAGRELWSTDGTASGTAIHAEIFPGSTGSNPDLLGDIRGTLYFTAKDSEARGTELWKITFDECPDDDNKTLPATCGCGVRDVDTDGNGVLQCLDPSSAPEISSAKGDKDGKRATVIIATDYTNTIKQCKFVTKIDGKNKSFTKNSATTTVKIKLPKPGRYTVQCRYLASPSKIAQTAFGVKGKFTLKKK